MVRAGPLELPREPSLYPGIFYPGGWDLRFTTLPPLYPLIFAPITAALGSVRTYNLMLLGSCVFAAYGGFVLASHISGSWWGACIAGVLFAYAPQREIYFGGHLNFLLGSMWLPWIIYGLLMSITASRHRSRWALFSGLAFGLSVVGAWLRLVGRFPDAVGPVRAIYPFQLAR